MKEIKQQYLEILRFFKVMIDDRRRHIIIAFFAGLSGMFFNLISAGILKGIYSAVISENSSLVYKYICLFILMVAGVFIYNYLCWKSYGSSSARITGGIRRTIISKLCSLRLSDMENHHSGNMMSVLTNDLDAAQGLYVNLRFYVTSLVVVFVPSILVFHISSILALLIILMGIMQLMINLLVIKPLEKQSVNIRENMSTINSTFVDVLRNNMSIRLYSSEDFYIKVCSDLNGSLYRSKMKLNLINAVTEGTNVLFGLLGYIILLTVGSSLVGANMLSLPDLLFVTQMRLMMIQGILAFGNYAVQIQPAVVGAKKILTLMDYYIEDTA